MSLLKRLFPGKRSKTPLLSPVKDQPAGSRDTQRAIRELSRAVIHDPDAVEIYLALGNLYRAQGDFERAVQIRSTLIVRPGLNDKFKARAYFELGHDYKRGGFIDRALQSFEQARRIEGDTEEIILSLARLYASSGNFERAAEYYAQLGHQVAQAHFMVRYAQELCGNGSESEGRRVLKKARKVYKGSVEAWLASIRLACSHQEWRKVSSILNDALSAVSPSLRFLLLEGIYSFTPENTDEAARQKFHSRLCKIVMPAIEEQEPELILQYYGALLLIQCGNIEEANAWLAKAMVLSPDFWAARLELLGLSMKGQTLSPVFENQLEYFVKQAHHVKKFVCTTCGMRRDHTFYVCPRCRSWHSVAFRLHLQD